MGKAFQLIGEFTVCAVDDPGNQDVLCVGPSIVATIDGQIQSLTLFVGTAAGNVRVAVYAADGTGGAPDTLLGESASVAAVEGWQTIPLVAPVPVSAGDGFWLACNFDDGGCATRLGAIDSAVGHIVAQAYGAMPDPFPLGGSAPGNRTRSFYCLINP